MAKETATEAKHEEGPRWPWISAFEPTRPWGLLLIAYMVLNMALDIWNAVETRALRRALVEREMRKDLEQWRPSRTEPSPPAPQTPR